MIYTKLVKDKKEDMILKTPIFVKIKDEDNVAIAVREIKAGTEVMEGVTARHDIPQAHKIALCGIPKDQPVIRYGVVLGYRGYPERRLDQ